MTSHRNWFTTHLKWIYFHG